MKKEKSDLMNPMEEVPAHAASGKRYPAEWTETFSAAKVTLFSKKAKNLILFINIRACFLLISSCFEAFACKDFAFVKTCMMAGNHSANHLYEVAYGEKSFKSLQIKQIFLTKNAKI